MLSTRLSSDSTFKPLIPVAAFEESASFNCFTSPSSSTGMSKSQTLKISPDGGCFNEDNISGISSSGCSSIFVSVVSEVPSSMTTGKFSGSVASFESWRSFAEGPRIPRISSKASFKESILVSDISGSSIRQESAQAKSSAENPAKSPMAEMFNQLPLPLWDLDPYEWAEKGGGKRPWRTAIISEQLRLNQETEENEAYTIGYPNQHLKSFNMNSLKIQTTILDIA
ncbi:hypothetical protein Ccrd_001933 [Cynara cardunculus var. scolymus]|uniref:Uncharacterized protein n=1 Tax=Cynara cardunculus var. scolymus TaxID=59895 RepID=A0A103XSB9_CYNCS|nr:hypothetical protein Ccrd_001933 [Cynara cardunculus var. scolymus]